MFKNKKQEKKDLEIKYREYQEETNVIYIFAGIVIVLGVVYIGTLF